MQRRWKVPANLGAGYYEDAVLKDTMGEHGLDTARGGSYCTPGLHPVSVDFIERETRHNEKNCLRCGKGGHWAKPCPAENRGFETTTEATKRALVEMAADLRAAGLPVRPYIQTLLAKLGNY